MNLASTPFDCIEDTKPWYAYVWPWFLMLGPITVLVAGAYTSWLAFSQQDALVVDDYYKQGKAINQDLQRDRVASALGLTFHAHYDPATGKLHGTLFSLGAPVTGPVSVHLIHPTQPEKDQKIEASTDMQGAFSIVLPMLERAHWQITLESKKRDWRLTGGWRWPQERAIEIKADLPVNR